MKQGPIHVSYHGELITRDDAIALGVNKYFEAKPCKNLHISNRLVSTRACIRCIQTIHKQDRPTKAKDQVKDIWKTIHAIERKRDADRKSKLVENQSDAERARVARRMRSPQWKLKSDVKAVIRRCIKNKKDCTHDELGYSAVEFKRHIESLFTSGMTWANYGKWHVDHIIPVIWFYNNGISDMKVISALSNVQPLWANDNMSKGDAIA